MAIFRPQPLLSRQQRTAVHLLGAVVARHLLALGRHPLADRHGQQHQRDRSFHYRQRHLQPGETGCLHHHQLAALGQHPQPQQRAKQRRHREEDLDVLRHAEDGVETSAQRIVTTLPGLFQLIDKLDNAGERHQHEQGHHDGVENRLTDITVKYAKRLHQAAPLLKRARKRRIGTVSHRFNSTASAK